MQKSDFLTIGFEMNFIFSFKLRLPTDMSGMKALDSGMNGEDATLDALIDRLAAAGCDDALIGTGLPGRIALEFDRTADSINAAMDSALADIRSVLPEAELLEVGPDFVGLSDVAAHVGVSRQNLRKLMLAHADSFPPALHDGSASIWHLAPLLIWLRDQAQYEIPIALLEVAQEAMARNVGIQVDRLNSEGQATEANRLVA